MEYFNICWNNFNILLFHSGDSINLVPPGCSWNPPTVGGGATAQRRRHPGIKVSLGAFRLSSPPQTSQPINHFADPRWHGVMSSSSDYTPPKPPRPSPELTREPVSRRLNPEPRVDPPRSGLGGTARHCCPGLWQIRTAASAFVPTFPPPSAPLSLPSSLRPETRSATSTAAPPFLTTPHATITLSPVSRQPSVIPAVFWFLAFSSHSFTLTQVSLELRPWKVLKNSCRSPLAPSPLLSLFLPCCFRSSPNARVFSRRSKFVRDVLSSFLPPVAGLAGSL